MKKSIKVALAIILTVLLTATCATVAVFAATADETQASNGNVCRIGAEGTGTYYTSIAAAVSAAKDGDVITVIKDTNVTSQIKVAKRIELTSENNSTITCSVGSAFFIGEQNVSSGYVTVSGNLTIHSTADYTLMLKGGSVTVEDNATVSSATRAPIIASDSGTTNNTAIYIKDNATVKVGSSGTDGKEVLYVGTPGAKVYISGGTVKSEKSGVVGVYFISKDGELNISGGTVTAPKNTIKVQGNKANKVINVSGGNVMATNGTYAIYSVKDQSSNNLTINISGDAKISSSAEKAIYLTGSNNNLYMTGGTVTATKQTVFLSGASSGTIDMSGGTIKNTNGNQCFYFNTTGKYTLNISGDAWLDCTNFTNVIYAYSNAGGTDINISGGKITGLRNAICIESAGTYNCNISGGTITMTGDSAKENRGTIVHLVHSSADCMVTVSGDAKLSATTHAIFHDKAASAVINIEGGTLNAESKAIFFDSDTGGTLNISGGTIKTTAGNQPIYLANGSQTVNFNMTGGTVESVDQNAIYHYGQGTVNATISGGTIKAKSNTISIDGGTSTFDITGGTIIATESVAIKGTGTAQTTTFNISGDAKVYAGKQAILSNNDGLTFNISGGTFTASKEHTPADNGSLFVIVTQKGKVNITGGKFILGGTNNGAQMIYQDATATGTTTVDGGLFINDNKVNKTIFSAKVNYISGRILYGKNIDTVISGTAAPKTVKAAYGTADNVYYLYTRFAATDENKAGTMVDGAQIRLTKGTTGMRFTTTFDEINGATYGTIIVPASYLANLNSFTLEALDAAGLTYLDIEAINGIDIVDGKVTIRAAITNIELNNYTTAFAAIAYAKVGDTYYYTAFDLADHARTVDYVATEALDDLRETKEGDYQNKVTAYGATLYSPYTATQREILEGFVSVTLNVPRPTGATLVNCGDGSYMYYVANATADTHTAYAASLVTAGFTQTATNDLEGNIYTTYTKGNQIVTVAYTPNTSELRVIMDMATSSSLPSNEQYTAPAAPVATTLTQIGQLYDDPATEDIDESTATETKSGDDYITNFTAGMGYVIRLEDGSFIVIDGGYKTEAHADNLYNVLKKQANGDDIVIAAWIFTHAHSDHVGTFEAFTSKYASSVTVKRFIYNFPAEEATIFADTTGHPNYTAIKNAMNKYDGAVTTIAHAGQVFNIANAKVNILFTYEMMQPNKELDYYNGCSVVFNIEVEGKTILFLADAGGDSITKDRELTYIKKIYTTQTLKADIVQAGHHGIDDLGNDYITLFNFYDLVDADIMLIPVADRFVKIDADSYVNIYDRAAYKQSGDATKYIAGATVTVLTLDNENVSANTYDNVDAYKNS